MVMIARTSRLACLAAVVGLFAAGCTSTPPPSPDHGASAVVLGGYTDPVYELAWSPDSARLATSGLHSAGVWDASTGQIVHTLTADREWQTKVVWSPDGTRLATIRLSPFDGGLVGVRVWDAATGATIHQIDHRAAQQVLWSPDSAWLAIIDTDKGPATIYSAATGEEVQRFTPDSGRVSKLAWSPDGTKLAVGTSEGAVLIRNAATGASLTIPAAHAYVLAVVEWSPDGNRLATAGGDNTLRIWDTATGARLLNLSRDSNVFGVAWSPDSARIATRETDALVWDASTGKLLHTFPSHHDSTWGVAWSPDGTRLATVGYDGTVMVWDPDSGAPIHDFKGHTDIVRGVAWSPDGTRIATAGGYDRTARIWRADGPPTATALPANP